MWLMFVAQVMLARSKGIDIELGSLSASLTELQVEIDTYGREILQMEMIADTEEIDA